MTLSHDHVSRRNAVIREVNALVQKWGKDGVGIRRDLVIPGVLVDTPAGVYPVGPELADTREAHRIMRSARTVLQ